MPADLTTTFLAQLDAALQEFEALRQRSQHDDLSGLSEADYQRVIAMCRAVVDRVAGPNSPYSSQVTDLLARSTHEGRRTLMIAGVIQSLRADLAAGYLRGIAELIHGEVFGDFLEMADHLLDQGYKDPAAVVIGSTLEAHLRQLCNKLSIPTEMNTASGLRPKKADHLNSELASAAAYNKLDQKNVTAWLDLRNKAAHGNYSDYTKDQVALLSQGVRNFITRNPA